MNKQLTKKTIGIAASAALMAAALSATAVAGPGNDNKGPKASIAVQAVCSLDMNDPSLMHVRTLITDKNIDGTGVDAFVESTSTQFIQGIGNNRGGNKFRPLGDPIPGPNSDADQDPVGNEFTTTVNLCNLGLSPDANAANAEVTVVIFEGHKTFTAKCGDDPATDEVEGGLKIGHLSLCLQN